MCQQNPGREEPGSLQDSRAQSKSPEATISLEPFPWDVGVYDAHCHPTGTMSSMSSISGMRARILTVMSTRLQDQDLVAEAASDQGVNEPQTPLHSALQDQARIVPSFGWHPWFSYQLYDDLAPNPTYDGTKAGKVAHYDEVLAPSPSTKDVAFAEGLPDPRPLSKFIEETKARLERYPLSLVGEIGLDKAFRLPQNWTASHETQRDQGLTPGGREGRNLSPFRVRITHQATILHAQLKLAGKMDRAVSVHGVQVHGILYDTISHCWKGHEKEVLSRRQKRQIAKGAEDFSSDPEEDCEDDGNVILSEMRIQAKSTKSEGKSSKPFPPRICLHSYSGHADTIKRYVDPSVPAQVFFSFSTAVNFGTGGHEKTEDAIREVPDDRILVESDLHTAGQPMDDALEDICRRVCGIKGWNLKQGVEKLSRNWEEFAFG
ncbi:hypothetical protein F5Y15DRAFT_360894 [Xylariaceae sp. FL0016]|nr:hypothetical protein F5Y15DRAFT_360894 [Xylariaceae sp. FL0016]